MSTPTPVPVYPMPVNPGDGQTGNHGAPTGGTLKPSPRPGNHS